MLENYDKWFFTMGYYLEIYPSLNMMINLQIIQQYENDS